MVLGGLLRGWFGVIERSIHNTYQVTIYISLLDAKLALHTLRCE